MRTTPEQRREWQALADAATPGPWKYLVQGDYRWIVQVDTGRFMSRSIEGEGKKDGIDMQFIAAARTAMPALLAEVAALEAQVATLHEVVKGLLTLAPFRYDCRYCSLNTDLMGQESYIHAADCPVQIGRTLLEDSNG